MTVSVAEATTSTTSKPTKVSQADVLTASKTLDTYIKNNKKLPNYITIGKTKYSMEEYLDIASKTIYYKYNKKSTAITVKYDIKRPTSTKGYTVKGKWTKKYYYSSAKSIINYNKKYNKAPTYVKTKLGTASFQTTVYAYAKILAWSKNNKGALPSYLSISISKTNSINKYLPIFDGVRGTVVVEAESTVSKTPTTSSAKSIAPEKILDASKRVKAYVVANKVLPKYVTIDGVNYPMEDYLYLITKLIVNKNSGKNTAITVIDAKAPAAPSGNNKVGNINKTGTNNYIALASAISSYIEKNKQAPNYVSSNLGNIPYGTAVYTFARIGDFINTNKYLPNYVTVDTTMSDSINGGSSGGGGSGSSSINEKYGGEALANYLKATFRAESNDSTIINFAKSLISGKTTNISKATAIYNYVRDNIGYSFYYNSKYGAKKTLSIKQGNCVDQAHLLVALYRAVGLPARYVHTYSKFTSSGWVGHLWVQVLVDGTWTAADPTSSRNSLGTILNWDTTNFITYGKYYEITWVNND
ncbi:MAG: transglutaminase domain-containing protein [Methanobrevibacter sp.]|nr:transglutaminase domain-containing protein [Methanobrevibacter sp.]